MRRDLYYPNVMKTALRVGRPASLAQRPGLYPPGAAPLDPPPRLPEMPIAAYAPPLTPFTEAPAPPANNITDDYEAYRAVVALPADGVERTIYTFQRFWRAADVYIQVPFSVGALLTPLSITVRVYARVQGIRTLIASGRFGPDGAGQRWVCAARGAAERYEVTIHQPLGLVGQEVGVSLVGTNEAPEPPEYIGSVPLACGAGQAPILTSTGELSVQAATPDIQPVFLQATKVSAGGPFWLQIHDTIAPIAPGALPVFSFGFLAANIGATIKEQLVQPFGSKRFDTGIGVGISTSAVAFASAGAGGDVAWQLWFR